MSLTEHHWLFMKQNLRQIISISKIVGIFASDDMLRAVEWHRDLFGI